MKAITEDFALGTEKDTDTDTKSEVHLTAAQTDAVPQVPALVNALAADTGHVSNYELPAAEFPETQYKYKSESTSESNTKSNSNSNTNIETATATDSKSKSRSLRWFLASKVILIPLCLILLLFLAAALRPALDWYIKTPRSVTSTTPAASMSIIAAWGGEADGAYALQFMPATYDSQAASSTARRQQLLRMTDSFVASSRIDKANSLAFLTATLCGTTNSDLRDSLHRMSLVSKNNPTMEAAYGVFQAVNGDFKGALKSTNSALKRQKNPTYFFAQLPTSAAYIWQADLLRSMGLPEQSLQLLNSADCEAANKDYGAELDFARARDYEQLGLPEKMLAISEKAGRDRHYVRALAFLLEDKYDLAVKEANIIDARGNRDYVARQQLLLSRIASKRGEMEKALVYAGKSLKISPSLSFCPNLSAFEQRLYVLNRLGRYEAALKESNELPKYLSWTAGSVRSLPDVYADRAEAFLKIGKSKEALLEAEHALSMNENCREALQVARDVCRENGDLQAATAYDGRIKSLKIAVDNR